MVGIADDLSRGMASARRATHVLPRGWRTRARRGARRLDDRLHGTRFATERSSVDLPVVLVRHASLLRRRLGDTDPALQEAKIVNLRCAIPAFDGLVIAPGETCSFWERVGRPTEERGFVRGLVLSRGAVSTGLGGGLCQLSNLLYWMALHSPLTVTEQHRHSFDPFPDDGRTLPFGSGATVVWSLVDLRLHNGTDRTFQLRVRLGDQHLIGAIRSDRPWPVAYHVVEHGHRFVWDGDQVFRENELHRLSVDRRTGERLGEELITRNRALVLYPPPAAVSR